MLLAFDVWLLTAFDDELEFDVVFWLVVLLLLFEEVLVLLFEFGLLELPEVEFVLVELLVECEFELAELFLAFEFVVSVEFVGVGIGVELGMIVCLLLFLF